MDGLPPPGSGAALGREPGQSEMKPAPNKFRRSMLDL